MSGALKELSPVLYGKILSWSLGFQQDFENNKIRILMVSELCNINALSKEIFFSIYSRAALYQSIHMSSLQNFVFSYCSHLFFTFNLLIPSIPMQSPSCCFFLFVCLSAGEKRTKPHCKPALILVIILSVYSKSTNIWKLTVF